MYLFSRRGTLPQHGRFTFKWAASGHKAARIERVYTLQPSAARYGICHQNRNTLQQQFEVTVKISVVEHPICTRR